MNRRGSRHKLFAEVKRRAWLVVLVIILAVAAAWAAGKVVPSSASAEAVLVVRAAGPLSEQPNSSTKLAATYATLIPLDTKIEEAVEDAQSEGNGSFSASNDPNTAIVRINFSADTKAEAIEGAKIVTRAITGSAPVSTNIEPNTIAVASLPEKAQKSGVSAGLLGVAGVLGLILGLILISFWRPRDARVDTVAELRGLLRCPCVDIDLGSSAGLHFLLDAIANSLGPRTVVVPASAGSVRQAEGLARVLNNAFGSGRVTVTGVPGSEDASELTVAGADTSLLVAAPGTRVADLLEVTDIVARYDALPDYAVLAGGRGGGNRPTDTSPAAADSTAPAESG